MTLRTDALLAELLRDLDQRVGKEKYVLMLSADHGIPPSPESLTELRIASGRNDTMLAAAMAANKRLTTLYGEPPKEHTRWVLNKDSVCIFLDTVALSKAGHSLESASRIAAEAAAELDQVEQAIPLVGSEGLADSTDPIVQAVMRGVRKGRSGQVYIVTKPYWLSGTATSTHGTPYPYDREVPLFILGGKMPLAPHKESAVGPGHGVTILAGLLGIPRPPFAPSWPPAPRNY
jgi:hypothetical protein